MSRFGEIGMRNSRGPFDYGEADIGYSTSQSDTSDLLLEMEGLTREVAVLRSQVLTLRQRNHELRRFVVSQLPTLVQKRAGQSDHPAQATPAANERRRLARRRTRLENGIILTKSYSVIGECSIYDKSEAGYRIKAREAKSVPSEFYLLRQSDGLLVQGHVRWQREDQLGCMILNSIAPLDFEYPGDQINTALAVARRGQTTRVV